ncbi:hypothetical protein HDV05_003497 [Chytridiales sp. JEL 0842]|nr:hypothetical protein HDV05_003497 [Chytridiales sp. JEL 0842]
MTVNVQDKPQASEESKVFFFDIDNCLYHKNTGIYILMGERIRDYFKTLGLDEQTARTLHHEYYTKYGLAIRGLIEHHEVDPEEYDRVVDGGLPLEDILKPDPELRQMLIDMRGARIWACTNAGYNAILRILGIADLFEGITCCDYTEPSFPCKPEPSFYLKAMKEAGVTNASNCFFVDDSAPNVDSAVKLGWAQCVHVADALPSEHGHHQITDIKDLPQVLPEFWPTRKQTWGRFEHGL